MNAPLLKEKIKPEQTMRLQKRLANAGYGSRRSIEEMLKSGRITLNNKTAKLGDKVHINDTVYLDGRKIKLSRFHDAKIQTLMLNKAVGVICTNKDNKKRQCVYQLLPENNRWVMVGRLDINSTGLLLFTNYGELAKRLMHPSFAIKRDYAVRVLGALKPHHIKKLLSDITVNGINLRLQNIQAMTSSGVNHWYRMTLTTGKNRQIRRALAALGFQVSRLIRIRYADIMLPKNLKANQYHYLSDEQTNLLLKSVGLIGDKI